MTFLRSIAAFGVSAVLAGPAVAQIAGCPDALGDQADAAVGSVTTWSAYAAWYRRYATCDDVDTAESIDSTTVRLLDQRWGELMRSAPRFTSDPGLRHLLLRHINAVGLTSRAARELAARAETRCASNGRPLCGAIALAARVTVQENNGR